MARGSAARDSPGTASFTALAARVCLKRGIVFVEARSVLPDI
jgi:hypothetical protein